MADTTKIALVTGANKGIGYEIARQLGAGGITVLIGARDPAKGRKAADELAKSGITAEAITLDVTDDASVNEAAEAVEERYGRLDILVNNAGIAGDFTKIASKPSSLPVTEFQTVYDTNVFGPVRVLAAFMPLLVKASAGRIVNVSSTLGSLDANADSTEPSAMGLAPYNSSKAALNRLMLDYAKELSGTPMKINNVCPGYVATDINDNSGPRSPEQGARIAVEMALLPDDGPSGTFRDENGVIAW